MVKTLLVGVIGYPIRHSLSPLVHNAWFQDRHLHGAYLPFEVPSGRLSPFMKQAVTLGLHGFNVTAPHKKAVIGYLDGLSKEARVIGAVNTVCRQGRSWKGTNTDWQGFLNAMTAQSVPLKNKEVFVFGSGGAARAIIYALCRAGVKRLVLASRNQKRARALTTQFQRHFPKICLESINFNRASMKKMLPQMNLFVNASSLGLKGERLVPSPIPYLKAGTFVFDCVYHRETDLVRQARKKDLPVMDGMGMFLNQAALSWSLWSL